MPGPNRTAITYRWERWRALTAGVLETASSTFLLLIAVRWFQAGALAKALIAGGGSVGLLLTPVVVTVVTHTGWPPAQAAARVFWLGAVAVLLAVLIPILPVFVFSSVVGLMCAASVIPLLTQLYQENYPEAERGRLFSRTVMIRIGMAIVFSKLAGDFLKMEQFRVLLLLFSAALAAAGYCLSRCPSDPLAATGSANPFRAMRYVREDRLFRQTLIAWMLMGFANLMMLPLRVEYLANPKYKLGLSVSMVALLTSVVPNLARLVMSPVWGWLFDKMNFFALRVTLNCGFALGILAFFASDGMAGLLLAAVVFGVSGAGGDVAWSLWVTKFAPPQRVADYMSVHTFFTGLRGVVAPLLAFYLASRGVPLGWMAAICAGLIGLATALLVPEIRWGRQVRGATALVEEVSE